MEKDDPTYPDRLVTRLRRHIPWKNTYRVTEIVIENIGPHYKAKLLNFLHTLHLKPDVKNTSSTETIVSIDVRPENRIFEKLLAYLHDVGVEESTSGSDTEKQKAPEIEDSEDCTYKNVNTPTTTTSETPSSGKQTDTTQSSEKQTDSQSSSKQTESEYELIISKPIESVPAPSSSTAVENSKEVIRSLLKNEKNILPIKSVMLPRKEYKKTDKVAIEKVGKPLLFDDKKKPWFQALFKKKRKDDKHAELLQTVHIVAINEKESSSSNINFKQGIRDMFNNGKKNLYKKGKNMIRKEESTSESERCKGKSELRNSHLKSDRKDDIFAKLDKPISLQNNSLLNCVKGVKSNNVRMEGLKINGVDKGEVGTEANGIKGSSLAVETWTQTFSRETEKISSLMKTEMSTQTMMADQPQMLADKQETPVCLEQSVKSLGDESTSTSEESSDSLTPSTENCHPYTFINGSFQGDVYNNGIPLYSPTMDATYTQYFETNGQFYENNNLVFKLKPVMASNFQNKQLFFRRVLKEFDEETDGDSTNSIVDTTDKVVESVKPEQVKKPKLRDIGVQKQPSFWTMNNKETPKGNIESFSGRPTSIDNSEDILPLKGKEPKKANPDLALSARVPSNSRIPKPDMNSFRIQDHVKRGLLWGRYPDGRYGWGQCYAPGRVLPITTWGPDYSVGRPFSRCSEEKNHSMPCFKFCSLFNTRRRQLKQEMMRQKQELVELKMILYSCLHEMQSQTGAEDATPIADSPLGSLKTVNLDNS